MAWQVNSSQVCPVLASPNQSNDFLAEPCKHSLYLHSARYLCHLVVLGHQFWADVSSTASAPSVTRQLRNKPGYFTVNGRSRLALPRPAGSEMATYRYFFEKGRFASRVKGCATKLSIPLQKARLFRRRSFRRRYSQN